MTRTLLRIDTSPRLSGSVSRALTDRITARLAGSDTRILARDLAETPIPQIDETWVAANFTPEDTRTESQRQALALSDALVGELEAADTIVIGLPIHNFGLPAALKAWIDQVARAGRTFRYTPEGPVGLLEGKRAILAIASGGTEVGSPIDFASGHLRHLMGFLGITDVEIVAADQVMVRGDASVEAAEAAVDALAA